MKKIVVASTNAVKINSALQGFDQIFSGEQFEVKGITVSSGISDQPMNNEETFQGAYNRVEAAMKVVKDADYWIGIEGGCEKRGNEIACFAWVVIKNKKQEIAKGRAGTFFLPAKIQELIEHGFELGLANDLVFGSKNSKQKDGIIGKLTNGVVDRTAYYTHAVILALVSFKNPELY